MAFRDVSANPDDFSDEPIEYPKFAAVGDKMAGVYVNTYESEGNYGKRKNFKFRGRLVDGTVGFLVVTPTAHLARSLEGADLKPGHKVVITFTGEKPMKGTNTDGTPKNPMKIFQVLVEDGKAAAPAGRAAPAPARAAVQPARQAPAPAARPAPARAAPPPGDFDFDAPADDGDVPI